MVLINQLNFGIHSIHHELNPVLNKQWSLKYFTLYFDIKQRNLENQHFCDLTVRLTFQLFYCFTVFNCTSLEVSHYLFLMPVFVCLE